MTDVELTGLGKLFSQSVFSIPQYQRGYSWTDTQVTDLIEDIEYTHQQRQSDQEDYTHYFGTIVLQNTGKREGQMKNFDSYNIIDGQQRLTTVAIVVAVITEELRTQSTPEEEDKNSLTPEEFATDIRGDFLIQHGTERLSLDTINDDTFQNLVTEGTDSDSINPDNIVQRRLATAKSQVREWLHEHKDKSQNSSYIEYLQDLGKVINSGFELTTYTIDDESEAGRLFEVVNDRGKDLTTLDKIKSYLVHCAARQGDTELSKEVYRKVGEVIRNITEEGGGDNEIESFVNYHWVLFTGEINRHRQSNSGYTDINRRIKHLKKHATLDQGYDSVSNWINAYLESITACSEIYQKIQNPGLLDPSTDVEASIKSDLEGLNNLPATGNFYPLLMTVYRRFGLGEEFALVTDLCEKISFRIYNVANDAAKISLSRHAYWVEWADRQSEAKSVFSGEQNTLEFDDEDTAIAKTCRMIESEIGSHCPDAYFEKCLLQEDIFEGSNENSGWTGVRNNNVITHLLYRYEKHLRSYGSKSSISQIPSYDKWKSEGISLEHIHPRNPDGDHKDKEMDDFCNALGNIALLGPEDNSSAGNLGYEEKYRSIYDGSSMEMIEDLPEPHNGWNKSDVQARGKQIVEFALSEWGDLSQAHVHVASSPSIDGNGTTANIASSIRNNYKRRSGFDLPSVHIQPNSAPSEKESVPHKAPRLTVPETRVRWRNRC